MNGIAGTATGPRPSYQGGAPFFLAIGNLSGLLAQAQTSGQPATPEEGGSWTWIILGVVGLLVVGGVLYMLFSQKGGKSKKKKVVVTDTQVANYRLVNLMMTGQTSQVWETSEIGTGRRYALKMLLPEHAQKADQRFFLFHEAKVGNDIIHPKIIKMGQAVEDPDNPFLIMEFFPSSNLKLRLMRKDQFLRDNAHTIIEQAATALAYMNEKGWVHRDVKPDNILVNSNAEVRLIDFALAQRISKGRGLMRKRNKAQGTRSYMSPEQIRGEPLDARADIYSFGATIFEIVTGRPPFRASSPMDLLNKQIHEKPTSPQMFNPEVSDDLAKLVLKMLSKKREDRPRDFHDFLAKFRNIRVFKNDTIRKKKEESY